MFFMCSLKFSAYSFSIPRAHKFITYRFLLLFFLAIAYSSLLTALKVCPTLRLQIVKISAFGDHSDALVGVANFANNINTWHRAERGQVFGTDGKK